VKIFPFQHDILYSLSPKYFKVAEALFIRLTSYKKEVFGPLVTGQSLCRILSILSRLIKLNLIYRAQRAAAPVAGVLDEAYSQLTPLSGVTVQARQST
jgi:hypothetical protein